MGTAPTDGGLAMRGIRRARIALLAVVTGAAVFAAMPGAANAGILVASAPNCSNAPTSQPFAQWNDAKHYFLAPGGNFEGGLGGWSLGGARAVADQEPWRVAGPRSPGARHPARAPAGPPPSRVG